MSNRNYSGIEQIKQYISQEVAPKYFDVEEVNDLNVGLLGMTTDIMATMSEDAFNTLSLFVKEAFPAQAQLPETIFTNSSFLDINEIMATPSRLNIALLVKIDDIINKGEYKGGVITFKLDSNMTIDVEGLNFMADYDIIITARKHSNDYIFSAQYDMSEKNSLSNIDIPYLKTFRVKVDDSDYLSIFTLCRQAFRKTDIENVIDNDIINKSTISITYENDLASFDAYYKEPGSSDYVPLKIVPYGTTPLKTPFCYYKLIDDSTYEISFTVIDTYFQPVFNSEIKVITHTTNGSKGIFRAYNGDKVSVALKNEKYDYNGDIVVFAMPTGASVGGKDRLTLEELRYKTVEKWSTSGAYNTESDLQSYFSNYGSDDTHVTFVKKRDDMAYRLFSSFALFKDSSGDFYPTNTLNLDVYRNAFDNIYSEGRGIIRAGSIFTYKDESSRDMAVKIDGDVSNFESDKPFMYTCPFVISIQKSPTIVGFYLNSIYKDITPDFKYANMNSFYQFILGKLSINRNAIGGDMGYDLDVNVIPSSILNPEDLVIDEETSSPVFLNNMKVVAGIMNSDGTNCIAYKEMEIKNFSVSDSITSFHVKFETNDSITQDERILIENVIKDDGTVGAISVPMVETKFEVFILFKGLETGNKLDLPGLEDYRITNTYSTDSTPVDLMKPMSMIRSRAKFMPFKEPNSDGNMADSYYYSLDLVPMVDYRSVNNIEKFKEYTTMLHELHEYLQSVADSKTNNFGVDMKFYNTYGRSKNFTVGEESEQLDKVNTSIHFKIATTIGADPVSLVPRIKAYIKDYIENINTSVDESLGVKGYNAVYVSNIMRGIELNFDQVKYIKFIGINDYSSNVQVIENGKTFDNLTKDQREYYVPEYLTISEDNITIDILE